MLDVARLLSGNRGRALHVHIVPTENGMLSIEAWSVRAGGEVREYAAYYRGEDLGSPTFSVADAIRWVVAEARMKELEDCRTDLSVIERQLAERERP